MRIVLDTNVILRAISTKSAIKNIIDSLYEGVYELCFSTEILLEYHEKISIFYGEKIAESFISFLLVLPNTQKIEPYFHLELIKSDYDDNKFVDCAFASNAHYIVTNDRHFRILSKIDFPKISVITAEDFHELLKE